ncbi:MAG TPA: UDP-N-acetylmuramate dehydrogenase [Chloroflexota bacterium]|nr:UDP-N-acetylmuramate dehydrogenase [Chloroflexota bacterium]
MLTKVPDALRDHFGHRLRVEEPLAMHTSFRIGGPSDLFISARTREDLLNAVVLARSAGIPWLVLGRGSNVLVDDRGIRGLVIRNDTPQLTIDAETGRVQAASGVRMPTLGVQTARMGLTGLEWCVGIPGSVGGGVVMNAGAHGGCIADALISAEVLADGTPMIWPAETFQHSYRMSRLQSEREIVVLGAEFRTQHGIAGEALGRIRTFRQHRQDTQPTDPGAGSIFRNPPGESAGALIDQAGLKGTRRGDALISPKHGNFIVNVGHASSSDVLALIELAREAVFQQFGIILHPEVELIGPIGRRKLAEGNE